MYFFACFVERTWRFGLPLVLAHIQGGQRRSRSVESWSCSRAKCWAWKPLTSVSVGHLWPPVSEVALAASVCAACSLCSRGGRPARQFRSSALSAHTQLN